MWAENDFNDGDSSGSLASDGTYIGGWQLQPASRSGCGGPLLQPDMVSLKACPPRFVPSP